MITRLGIQVDEDTLTGKILQTEIQLGHSLPDYIKYDPDLTTETLNNYVKTSMEQHTTPKFQRPRQFGISINQDYQGEHPSLEAIADEFGLSRVLLPNGRTLKRGILVHGSVERAFEARKKYPFLWVNHKPPKRFRTKKGIEHRHSEE